MALVPQNVSSDDADKLIKEINVAEFYKDSDDSYLSVDLEFVDVTISYWFDEGEARTVDRDVIKLVTKDLSSILLLVSEAVSIPPDDGDHYLSWIDITKRGREIAVWYTADKYNSQWNLDFILSGKSYQISSR